MQAGSIQQITSFGDVPWSRQDLVASLEEFADVYRKRPIPNNAGGMKAPHMFSTWFGLKRLQPKAVVESGVWLGQGTWLIEQACPQADLYCIEPVLDRIVYRSQKARYFDRDFATLDWTALPAQETVLFFDDHQNAYERIKTARWFGFKHAFFEDNYPPSQGDCYSLKKAFSNSGFRPPPPVGVSAVNRMKGHIRRLLGVHDAPQAEVRPNSTDAAYLKANLAAYYEFPPLFRLPITRWGDAWTDERYPTPAPLLDRVAADYQQVFRDEADNYTWICYVRIKQWAG